MPPMDGGDVRVHYLWEDNGFDAAPSDSTAKVWGTDARLTTAQPTNNGRRIYLPASQTPVDIKPSAGIEGAWAVTFNLCTPWFLRALLGDPGSPTDNGDGSYTYTFNGEPDPLRIYEGYETLGPDERVLTGCVARRADITISVDQDTAAQVTMEGFYADEPAVDTSASLTTQPEPALDELDFADAQLDVDSSQVTHMLDGTLSIEWPNLGPQYVWGSDKPDDYRVLNFEPSFNASKLKTSNDHLTDLHGGSDGLGGTDPDLTPLTVTLGDATGGSSAHEITFDGTNVFEDSYDEEGVGDPASTIRENIDYLISDLSATATNGTSSAP